MTALIVIGCIIGFIALILSFSVTLYVSISDEVTIKIGGFGYKYEIDLQGVDVKETDKGKLDIKEKVSIKKKKPGTKKTVSKKVDEATFGETVEIILSLIKASFKPAKFVLKHVRITSLRLNMTVSGDQADETAIKHGQVSMLIYNLLGHLDNLLKLKIKNINIIPDFVTGQSQYDITFKVKIRLCVAIWAALGIFCKFIANTMKNNKTLSVSE